MHLTQQGLSFVTLDLMPHKQVNAHHKFLKNYIINKCDRNVVDNVFEILKKMFLFDVCIQKVAKLEFLIDV
jgi:hypothetical protein